MITVEDYILYGFLAFICLLLVSIVVGMFRQFRDTGEIKGRMEGMQRQIDEMKTDLSGRIDEMRNDLSGRIDEVRNDLSGRIDEVRNDLSGRIDEVKNDLSGRIDEVRNDFSGRIDEVKSDVSERIEGLSGRVERLEQNSVSLAGEVGEVKGLLLALHQRMDLLMRHRHDAGTNQVILTPEEVAAD